MASARKSRVNRSGGAGSLYRVGLNLSDRIQVMSTSALVLILFISWALLLLVLMEVVRSYLVVIGRVRSNEFNPENSNLSPFMQRLARAHANCVEGLPIFGGLLVVALVTGRTTEVTDALAPWLLGARVVQSSIHLASLSVVAVNARFTAFAVQIAIAAYWAWALIAPHVSR